MATQKGMDMFAEMKDHDYAVKLAKEKRLTKEIDYKEKAFNV